MDSLISWIQPAIIIALILFIWRDTNRKIERLDDKIDALRSEMHREMHQLRSEMMTLCLPQRMGRPEMAFSRPQEEEEPPKQDEEDQEN